MRLQKVALAVAVTLITLGFTRIGHATTFTPGEFVTGSQVEWGEDPTPTNIAGILNAQFSTVYASTNGLLQVGVSGSPGYHYMVFDSPDALIAYLPNGGQPAALTADLDDPVSTSARALGGEVTTLKLNIDFSTAGLLAHPQGVTFGNLILTDLTGTLSPLNGLTVNELLIQEDLALGGAPSDFSSFQDAFVLANDVDMAFNVGELSTFAQQNLEIPEVSTTPLPGTLPLLATGVGALGLIGRRRKRKAHS